MLIHNDWSLFQMSENGGNESYFDSYVDFEVSKMETVKNYILYL